MNYTIFYSWQSDTDPYVNNYLIKDAISAALKKLTQEASIEEAIRLDQDTKGLGGTPEVANTVFNKIDNSGLFIADLSLVASVVPRNGNPTKKSPNPNVLLESGYASARMGWERIIFVMNEHFGTAEEQIFDVKHRRFPIRYTLDPHNLTPKKKVVEQLSSDIAIAIKAAASAEHDKVQESIKKLDATCLNLIRLYPSKSFYVHPLKNKGDIIDYIPDGLAINRMLDLGLLMACFEESTQNIRYDWTYLGKLLIKRFNSSE